MLADIRASLKEGCRALGDYKSYSIEYLLDRYCEALDSNDREAQGKYISALCLRCWNKISYLQNRCASLHLSGDECWELLVDRINYACKYRIWQDKTKKIKAETALNQAIATEVKNQYYFSNLHKNILNHTSVSLDASIKASDSDDKDMTLADVVNGNDYEMLESTICVRNLVQKYINEDKLIEAIISDRLAFTSPFKTKKHTEAQKGTDGRDVKVRYTTQEYSKALLAAELQGLSSEFARYFVKNYKIKSHEALKQAILKLRGASSAKKSNYIRQTFSGLREIWQKY